MTTIQLFQLVQLMIIRVEIVRGAQASANLTNFNLQNRLSNLLPKKSGARNTVLQCPKLGTKGTHSSGTHSRKTRSSAHETSWHWPCPSQVVKNIAQESNENVVKTERLQETTAAHFDHHKTPGRMLCSGQVQRELSSQDKSFPIG